MATVAAVGLGVTVTMSPATAATNMSDKLVGADSSWAAVSQTLDQAGRTVDSWRSPTGGTLTASGPPGLQVKMLPTQTTHGTGQRVDHRVGFAVTAPSFKPTSQPTAARTGQTLGLRLLNYIYQTVCINWSSSDGQVYFYGCDTQYLDADYGGGNWYMADKQQISGRSSQASYFTSDHLTSLDSYVRYGANNQVIQWNPGSNINVGSCTTVTVGITSSQTGINYSESGQVCPNYVGIYTLNSTQFGTIWHGVETYNYEWEGTEGTDEVHDPYNASPSITYYGYVNWCNWCA